MPDKWKIQGGYQAPSGGNKPDAPTSGSGVRTCNSNHVPPKEMKSSDWMKLIFYGFLAGGIAGMLSTIIMLAYYKALACH